MVFKKRSFCGTFSHRKKQRKWNCIGQCYKMISAWQIAGALFVFRKLCIKRVYLFRKIGKSNKSNVHFHQTPIVRFDWAFKIFAHVRTSVVGWNRLQIWLSHKKSQKKFTIVYLRLFIFLSFKKKSFELFAIESNPLYFCTWKREKTTAVMLKKWPSLVH